MIELYFETDSAKLPPLSDRLLPVLMFGKSAVSGKYNSIGGAALIEFRRLQEESDETAFDLMMLSLLTEQNEKNSLQKIRKVKILYDLFYVAEISKDTVMILRIYGWLIHIMELRKRV